MHYTTKETAKRWNVTATGVSILCKQGRVSGAVEQGNRWLIPGDVPHPTSSLSTKYSSVTNAEYDCDLSHAETREEALFWSKLASIVTPEGV